VHSRLVVGEELGVDVNGFRVLHVTRVDAADRAARVGLLQVLQALVQIVLEQKTKHIDSKVWF